MNLSAIILLPRPIESTYAYLDDLVTRSNAGSKKFLTPCPVLANMTLKPKQLLKPQRY